MSLTAQSTTRHHRTGRLAFYGTQNLPICHRQPDQVLYPPTEIRTQVEDGTVAVIGIWANGRANDPYCGSVEARVNAPVDRLVDVIAGVCPVEIEVVKIESDFLGLPSTPEPVTLTPSMFSGWIAGLGEHVRVEPHDDAEPEVGMSAQDLHRTMRRQAPHIVDPRLEATFTPCVSLGSGETSLHIARRAPLMR